MIITRHNFEILGKIYLASEDDNLIYLGKKKLPEYKLVKEYQFHNEIEFQLKAYLNGDLKQFNIKTKFNTGTDFQKQIWQEISDIPYGKTLSYKEFAIKIGRESSVRAIATAIAKNPLPVIIPCHRIIKNNGEIGDYILGKTIKKALIEEEKFLHS